MHEYSCLAWGFYCSPLYVQCIHTLGIVIGLPGADVVMIFTDSSGYPNFVKHPYFVELFGNMSLQSWYLSFVVTPILSVSWVHHNYGQRMTI